MVHMLTSPIDLLSVELLFVLYVAECQIDSWRGDMWFLRNLVLEILLRLARHYYETAVG